MKQFLQKSKLKALLIDDDSTTESVIKNIIINCASAELIGQALNGESGIEMITQHHPKLVIIDLHINGSSGFDLLLWVKEFNPKIKVAIISNSLKPEYKMIAESLGADYFLDKQKELNTIETIVETIIKADKDLSQEQKSLIK